MVCCEVDNSFERYAMTVSNRTGKFLGRITKEYLAKCYCLVQALDEEKRCPPPCHILIDHN